MRLAKISSVPTDYYSCDETRSSASSFTCRIPSPRVSQFSSWRRSLKRPFSLLERVLEFQTFRTMNSMEYLRDDGVHISHFVEPTTSHFFEKTF